MKFLIIFKFVLLILIINTGLSLRTNSKKFMSKSETKINSDSVLDRVRTLIREISNTRLKSENLNIKKKQVGVLPEGYPEEMIKNAKKMRMDKKLWSRSHCHRKQAGGHHTQPAGLHPPASPEPRSRRDHCLHRQP